MIEKGVDTSFYTQFNEITPFRVTSRPNHGFGQSTKKINCKKRMSWNNIFRQWKDLHDSFLIDQEDHQVIISSSLS